jgi:hypothetical protein
MVAPAVLMTTSAILAGGIQTMYAGVNDRMRAMTAERLSRLTDEHGQVMKVTDVTGAARERLKEIDTQLPLLLRRHRRIHDALMMIYVSVLVVVLAMVLIAVSISVPAPAVGDVALVLVLLATATLLVGVIQVALSVRQSLNAVDYEVERALRLGSG